MKIEFTGRQTEISTQVRKLAERKLGKVERVLPRMTRAHVILTADKRRQVAEVSAHSRNLDLSAVGESTNPRLAVSSAIDKLLRQAQRQRAKQRDHRGAASPRRPTREKPASAPRRSREVISELPRVIRNRRRVVKPMTLDEATAELENRAEGVLVFRDARSERMGVLYRRVDGHLGLIEPDV